MNTKSSSSTPLLETSIFASRVQSRRHLDDHTYCYDHHQDHQHHRHENDLHVDASMIIHIVIIIIKIIRIIIVMIILIIEIMIKATYMWMKAEH